MSNYKFVPRFVEETWEKTDKSYTPTNEELAGYILGQENKKIDQKCEEDRIFCSCINNLTIIQMVDNLSKKDLLEKLNKMDKDTKELARELTKQN